MNRREALAAVGAVGVAATSGCLGHTTDDRGVLEVDRPGVDVGGGCEERELLDFERVHLAPIHFRLLGFENAVQWEVPLREGEELSVRVTNPDELHPPVIEVTDPDGTVIVDDDLSENDNLIHPDRDGAYTLWIGDRRTEGGEWFVDVVWYNEVGCSDPYSR